MTATSLLDDHTTNAIRQAIGAAGRGSLAEACEIGEQALTSGGDVVALNAMLGMLRCQAGQFEAGIDHLRIAHEARPADPKIATNLAMALVDTGRHRDALDVLTQGVVGLDPTMHLLRLRGFLAQSCDEYRTAADSYQQLVAAVPSDWEAWNNLGNALRGAGDFEGSVAALKRAAEIEPASPPILLNLALAVGAAGDLAEAERRLRLLADEYPAEVRPLKELHALLKEQGRDEEALEAIESAVARDPSDIESLLALGSHQSQLQHYDAAEASYRQVIALEPKNDLANLGLALSFELTNRTTELADLVLGAETRGVDSGALNFIRAFSLRRQRRFQEGLKALDEVPDSLETARRSHLLGQLLEGAGRYDEAFAAFERMNELNRDDPTLPDQRGQNYRSIIRSQFETLGSSWLAEWRDAGPVDDRPSPAFLVGFPRSGTTLLDTMLMGHPRIEVLEEEPALKQANRQLAGFDSLPGASDQQIQTARDAYFEAALALTPLKPGNLLVDKNPLTMNSLPFARRLFPDAKIILALRHPCDVVLSCFATNFRSNDGMASFLRLETAAELYDLSFSYLHHAEEMLQLPIHRVIYENVVADRERELKPLFEFLELEWSDQVLEHETTAKGRGRVKTASYAQIVEPLYARSAGRWWNYRKHLEPIFPVLRPWVEKFGYSLEDPTQIPADKGRE